MYVEPVAVSPSGKHVLLAGTPNYLYTVGARGQMVSVKRDSIFGVVLDSTLTGITVPNPVQGLPASMRAAPRPGGGWDVVFAEMPAEYRFPEAENVLRLWHGVLQTSGWETLNVIPTPSAMRLSAFNSSALVVHGDTISWAMTFESSESAGVALLQLHKGSWALELQAIPSAAYARLTHTGTDGVLLVTVVREPGASVSNSFLVHSIGGPGSWRLLRSFSAEHEGPVRGIHVTGAGDNSALSWHSVLEDRTVPIMNANVMFGELARAGARPLVLDTNIADIVAVQPLRHGVRWVVSALSANVDEQELRFYRGTDSGIVASGRLPNRFRGPFSAIETAADTLLLGGPLLRTEGDSPTLVLQFVRVHNACAPGQRTN